MSMACRRERNGAFSLLLVGRCFERIQVIFSALYLIFLLWVSAQLTTTKKEACFVGHGELLL